MIKKIYRNYIDACEAYYPLMADYGDGSVIFYKTKYITNQKPFVPRIQGNNYPILKDCLAQDVKTGNMLSVFRQVKIDKSKYRLLLEEVPENTEALDWYEVTETWGYTPKSSFTTSVITAWERPAFKPGLELEISKPITNSIINDDNTATLYCNNSDNRILNGSVILLKSSEYTVGDEEFYQMSDNIQVSQASEDSFIVQPFLWSVYNLSGQIVQTIQSFNDDSVFKKDNVQIIAKITGESRSISLINTDTYNKMHVIQVDNSDGMFQAGDIIKFTKEYWKQGLQWYFKQVSDFVKIEKSTDDTIIVPFFYWNVYDDSGGTYKITSDNIQSGFYVPGSKSILLIGEERQSLQADFAGRQVVDFTADFAPKEAWFPESGREIVNFLSYYTTPTLEEYLNMIARGDMILAQPQVYEKFLGDIYKRTSIYVKCQ